MNIDDRSISIIRKEYTETVKAYREAEIKYNQNRKSRRAQAIKEFCAAQEMELSNLCRLLNIQLWDNDFNLIEYNEIVQEV